MLSLAAFGRLFSAVNNNNEKEFRFWIFEPGMAYGDPELWWPSLREKRPRPHEGIDFFCYEDCQGIIHNLSSRLVPAPCDGTVIGLCPDFLGHSVFLLPDQLAGLGGIYVLAHISPHVCLGQRVQQGNVVGRVAVARGAAPGHLHVSYLQGEWRDLPLELSWPALFSQRQLQFVRPFSE